jgi:DNA-binding MarR family transcriptional regulator
MVKVMRHITTSYTDIISLIEGLHRRFLGLVKRELDRLRIYDVNNAQCVLLCNIGEAEVTMGELISRGYYVGSNVSYNVKKLVENGYLLQERSAHDRRSNHVRLTHKGYALRDRVSEMYGKHTEMLNYRPIPEADLQAVADVLRRLEQVWMYAGGPAEKRERAAVRGGSREAARSFWQTRLQKNHSDDDRKTLQEENVAASIRPAVEQSKR